MSHYELLVILPGKLSETELPAAQEAVRSLCTAGGVTIIREENLGKKKLSYDMKGEQYGYYYAVECDADPEKMHALSLRMRLSPEIVRHVVHEKPVKSQETLARETQLRERVAQRRAAKAATKAMTSLSPSAPPAPAVDIAALDQKLEELLTTPEKV